MQKLNAIDANFLYTETEQVLNHVASLQHIELPEGVSAGEFIASLKGFMQARIHLVSYLTRKLKFVPGNFDHPFWVQDSAFDINNHIIEVAVDAPGADAEVEAKVAELHSLPMDRSKPLWMMYVLTGLEKGRIAYINQIHHAAIDGMSGQAATMILMDETPDHPPVIAPECFPLVEDPTTAELLQQSFENLIHWQLGSATRVLGMMDSSRRMMARMIDPAKEMSAYGRLAPRTRFNKSIIREKSWAMGELPLNELKTMGKPLGCTINDLVMAVCAGGLRRYLERSDELPAEGLVAGCPVSLRKPGDETMGNQVTMMSVDLNTQEKNPVLRLLAIRNSAQVAKEITADLASAYDSEVSIAGLPVMAAASAAMSERLGLVDQLQSPVNVVISNVPGPRNTLYSNGAKMLTHIPVSIPAHGVGLNITVQSYDGVMYLGITACSRALPDPHRLRDDMLAAYRELKSAMLPANLADFRSSAASAKQVEESAAPVISEKVA